MRRPPFRVPCSTVMTALACESNGYTLKMQQGTCRTLSAFSFWKVIQGVVLKE